jgi:Protein of unknown function (DUF2628)/GYF domain 2
MQVYIAKDGRQEGPYTIEYVNSEAVAGRIQPTDLAWMQGWSAWQPVSMVPGFLSASPPPLPPAGAPPPPPPPTPGGSAPGRNLQQEELLRLFVGKNYEYYSRKWAEAEQKPSKNTWNWAALFFNLWWTAYRKMYRYAWIVFGIGVAETICNYAFGLSGVISGAINIGIAIAYGLQGNRWYKLHAEQRLSELAPTGTADEATRARIAKAGGTSGGAVAAFAGASFAVGLFIAIASGAGQVQKPHGEISNLGAAEDTQIVNGDLDYGFNVRLTVRNTGAAGTIIVTPWLTCSEGQWTRSQQIVFDAGESKQLTYFFNEPTINATNVQYGARATP